MNIICVIMSMFFVQALCQRYRLEEDIANRMSMTTGVLPDKPNVNTSVEVQYYLIHVVDHDYNQQVLETSGWLSLQWKDDRLTWNPEDHGGIDSLSMPCEYYIKPDIKLYNGVKGGMVIDKDTNCLIYSTGTVVYIPIVTMKSFCPSEGPEDSTLTCKMKLGAWTYSCDKMSLAEKKNYLDVSEFDGGWRWELQDSHSDMDIQHYSCCPEPYCHIEIELVLTDNSRKVNSWF